MHIKSWPNGASLLEDVEKFWDLLSRNLPAFYKEKEQVLTGGRITPNMGADWDRTSKL